MTNDDTGIKDPWDHDPELVARFDACLRKMITYREKEKAEGGEMFMGTPDRWFEGGLRRCVNDHVSRMVLKSEALGRHACLACGAPVFMTFPEDKDGPLEPYVAPARKSEPVVMEWIGSVCGIVTPYESTGDPNGEYKVGDEDDCTECESPVNAACVATLRAVKVFTP